jgi:hypothetical protein
VAQAPQGVARRLLVGLRGRNVELDRRRGVVCEVAGMSVCVARCDYCGNLFPTRDVVLYWVHVETLDDGTEDGTEVVTTGIYCSEPCGEWSSSRAGTARG